MNIRKQSKLPIAMALAMTGIFLLVAIGQKGYAHFAVASYHLDVKLIPEKQQLKGKATITVPSGHGWKFFVDGLEIHEIALKEKDGASFSLPLPEGNVIEMYGGKRQITLTISYTYTVTENDYNNLISEQGIVLTSAWHPLPSEDMIYSLEAVLPTGFYGISESDDFPEQLANSTMRSSFSQPVRGINLAAGPYRIDKETIGDDLTISTWFFPEDQDLSRQYLEATKNFILRYEKEIGPFPYQHYGVVSNRLPSGFGMPSYTLLGQMILRLPFIKSTSLRHEVLHSWFGNSIRVSDRSGNWCEALTSYLADHAFEEENEKGVQHRKNGLLTYLSYAGPKSAISVGEFHSASHQQAMARAVRAVGYQRGAMIFHQLRGLLGAEDFAEAIRLFASRHKGKSASWKDIQAAFETVSQKNLSTFFTQQLTRRDIPRLSMQNLYFQNKPDHSLLHLTVKQHTAQPYDLRVPFRVTTMGGDHYFIRELSQAKTELVFQLSEPPLSVTLDPDYDLFRQLEDEEVPPVWAKFMGAYNKLVVTGGARAGAPLAPFETWAQKQGWKILDHKDVSNQMLTEHAVLFLGADTPLYRSLFGETPEVKTGFSLKMSQNPLNRNAVIGLAASDAADETRAVISKLGHYGKYSFLHFKKGRNTVKEIMPATDGIHRIIQKLSAGYATRAQDSFSQIMDKLAANRVIYLGESHDAYADHLLQLQVIQALHQRGLDLAVGMEMFPAASQPAIDQYVLESENMDEAQFLRASKWFDVWGQDFRLFRPVFAFVRKHKIPVFGINIEREIVSSVFSAGNTDQLTPTQEQTIARERDLGLEGYAKGLRTVHGFHQKMAQNKNKTIGGFIQSQAIWDESMAQNIYHYMEKNPQKTVVVIAGVQHTRKDFGIPPRLKRRMAVKQASILNIKDAHSFENQRKLFDYVFMLPKIQLAKQGKLGIILTPEKDERGDKRLRISGISHTGKAGKAGIKKEDILMKINDEPVKNMQDVRIVMMDAKPGDFLPVTVLRFNDSGEPEQLQLSVELSDFSRPSGRP